MDIQDLKIFVRVAALQNLSAVGVELGLTPGTISKRLQALEDELNVRLFERTTRTMRITAEGKIFCEHALRILAEIDSARAIVGQNASKPTGRIKLSSPASLGQIAISDALTSFMRTYPDVDVTVNITDRIVNLQDEGYDLAIRTGVMPDSTLIAKRLWADCALLVASPGYLDEKGIPTSASDLARHECLMLGDQTSWSLGYDGSRETVRVGGRLRSNNSEFLYCSALAGQGIMKISRLRAAQDLAAGRLLTILATHEVASDAAIWAVYPSSRYMLPRLRVLLDFLGDWFRDLAAPPVPCAESSDA